MGVEQRVFPSFRVSLQQF